MKIILKATHLNLDNLLKLHLWVVFNRAAAAPKADLRHFMKSALGYHNGHETLPKP
jgi:hypothetical protein